MLLGEGLEEVGGYAFTTFGISLREIVIISSFKVIKEGATIRCSQLNNVVLGEGPQEIGHYAFGACTSPQRIEIPPDP